MKERSRRNGAVLFGAVACLAVLLALCVSMVSGSVHRRLLLAEQTRLRQAELLLESAVRRAAFQRSRDSAYDGETWRPLIKTSPVEVSSKVSIRLEPRSDGSLIANVTVTHPAGQAIAVRRSAAIPLDALLTPQVGDPQ